MDYLIFVMILKGIWVIQSLPINKGLSVKFYPISSKEETKSKSFGALFAKIPQAPGAIEQLFSKAHFPHRTDLGLGCTNQIAKIMFPLRNISKDINRHELWDNVNDVNFINLPMIKQPYNEYKILVATAPPNFKMGKKGDERPFVIYVVFSDDADKSSTDDFENMPSIYFLRKCNNKNDYQKKQEIDPIIIVDSNRTVTGLTSKEVSKYIKFRSKLLRADFSHTSEV